LGALTVRDHALVKIGIPGARLGLLLASRSRVERHDSGTVAARYRHAFGGLSVRFLVGQSVRNPADSAEFSAHARPALRRAASFAGHQMLAIFGIYDSNRIPD
jgi:hypothetical protein